MDGNGVGTDNLCFVLLTHQTAATLRRCRCFLNYLCLLFRRSCFVRQDLLFLVLFPADPAHAEDGGQCQHAVQHDTHVAGLNRLYLRGGIALRTSGMIGMDGTRMIGILFHQLIAYGIGGELLSIDGTPDFSVMGKTTETDGLCG